MYRHLFSFLIFILAACSVMAQRILLENPPPRYICYRAQHPITADGKLDEADWQQAPWIEQLVPLEGDSKPAPHLQTRIKMLWDEQYLYIAAELEEPHLWATLTERESTLFLENCFEIFIDPTGDTHLYYELQINALGTVWDMILTRPYRNGGISLTGWDISGMKKGIALSGTLNQPADTDTLWTLELALPWHILRDAATRKQKPSAGDVWRFNFARVQHHLEITDGQYRKKTNPETGRPITEDIWVWAPHHAFNMHMPEYFGYVMFSDAPPSAHPQVFSADPDAYIRYGLRELYYLQHAYFKSHGRFAPTLTKLMPELLAWALELKPEFDASRQRFTLSVEGETGIWHITEDSRIWRTPLNP